MTVNHLVPGSNPGAGATTLKPPKIGTSKALKTKLFPYCAQNDIFYSQNHTFYILLPFPKIFYILYLLLFISKIRKFHCAIVPKMNIFQKYWNSVRAYI